jgi:hypothetical protein
MRFSRMIQFLSIATIGVTTAIGIRPTPALATPTPPGCQGTLACCCECWIEHDPEGAVWWCNKTLDLVGVDTCGLSSENFCPHLLTCDRNVW